MTVDVLEWSYNPWRDRPGRAVAALVATVAGCAALASVGMPGLPTLALCAALVASFAIALVPVRCRLDPQGATRRNGWMVERRPWRDLQRAARTRDGILLSPFRRRHWLEAYRALFLPLPERGERPADGDLERMLASHGL